MVRNSENKYSSLKALSGVSVRISSFMPHKCLSSPMITDGYSSVPDTVCERYVTNAPRLAEHSAVYARNSSSYALSSSGSQISSPAERSKRRSLLPRRLSALGFCGKTPSLAPKRMTYFTESALINETSLKRILSILSGIFPENTERITERSNSEKRRAEICSPPMVDAMLSSRRYKRSIYSPSALSSKYCEELSRAILRVRLYITLQISLAVEALSSSWQKASSTDKTSSLAARIFSRSRSSGGVSRSPNGFISHSS